jgi:hypothetical protein
MDAMTLDRRAPLGMKASSFAAALSPSRTLI